MTDASTAERILCDTSFVSIMQTAERHQDLIAAWPQAALDRLNTAVLAISVVTLAELRDGHIYAGWGEPRRRRAEAIIAAYLRIPLDVATLDTWAELSAACRSSGTTVPHNDLWIAATAVQRGWPLVSCDLDFDDVPRVDHIYLPPRLVTS
jgi:tRNA(fMet)-specific endonuclease VapC